MKRIAIISYYHTESSLCLAKYIAEMGVEVDYYFFRSIPGDTGAVAGIEYKNVKRRFGIIKLSCENIPEMFSYAGKAPVNYHVISTMGESRRYRWLTWLITKYSLDKIKNKHYDAINVVGQVPPVMRLHRFLKNENLIHTLHEVGSHQNDQPSTPLIDSIIRDNSKVILHSHSTYQRFLSINGAKQSSTTVIPFGKFETNLLYENDTNLTLELQLPSDKTIFLFFGYMRPYKGLDILKETVEQLKQCSDNYYLIVAGGGTDPCLDYFRQEKDCLVINKFLSNNEMMKLNRMADIVLMPYHSASQTGIAPTAFMFGNPIIATRVGALPEVIKDGFNGLLVKKDDPRGFAEAMLRLIESPSLVSRLRKGALSFGDSDSYDWRSIAKKTLDFYFS